MSRKIEFERESVTASVTKRYVLDAGNIRGTVEDISPTTGITRATNEQQAVILAEQLASLGLIMDGAIEIEVTEQTRSAETLTRSTPTQGMILSTQIPFTTRNRERQRVKQEAAVIVFDHNTGEFYWIPPKTQDDNTRGIGAEFVLPDLPDQPANLPEEDQQEVKTRGVLGNIVRRSVYIVRWLVGDKLEEASLNAATDWEQRSQHNYGFFHVDPQAEDDDVWIPFQATGEAETGNKLFSNMQDWSTYNGKRSLLLIHGTFARAQNTYEGLIKHVPEELKNFYEGRIFAFNHRTLSQTPEGNATYFRSQIPEGIQLELDIVMHSRGGMVGRELIDVLAKSQTGKVKKAIFVAAANAGTILLDDKHWDEMGNRFMNLLGFLPDNISPVAEGLILVLKLAQSGAFEGISGLRAMDPIGDYVKHLAQKSSHGAEYYAMMSNYEPNKRNNIFKRFLKIIGDSVVDTVFENKENDLVVPTDGCFTLGELDNNVNGFPIPDERCCKFPLQSDPNQIPIFHTTFFNDGETSIPANQQILEWLLG